MAHYQSALAINPNYPNANYNLADFLLMGEQYSEAMRHFDREQRLKQAS